jgi:hypothetical protein
VVHGIGSCSGPRERLGGYSEDLWSFNPLASSKLPLPSTLAVEAAQGAEQRLRIGFAPLWIFDPATGLAYTAGNRAYADRGGRLIDFSRTPPVDVLVNTKWPYGNINGAVSVDTTNHWAIVLGTFTNGGPGTIEMWNLNGLSMTKYDAKSPFVPDAGWTITGDTDILSAPRVAGLTYNPNLGAFAAWRGGDTVYFLYPDYQHKVINIIGKVDISDGPPGTPDNFYGGFTYINDMNEYLAFSNTRNDFYLLVPPKDSGHASNP